MAAELFETAMELMLELLEKGPDVAVRVITLGSGGTSVKRYAASKREQAKTMLPLHKLKKEALARGAGHLSKFIERIETESNSLQQQTEHDFGTYPF